MMSLFNLIFASVFVNNIVTHSLLGIPTILDAGYQKILKNGMALIIITILSSMANYYIYDILVQYNVIYLKTGILILLIVILTKLLSIIFKNVDFNHLLTNTIILGITLLNIQTGYNLIEVVAYSLASSVGFLILTFLVMIISDRMAISKIKEPLKGIPITLITMSILYLIFYHLGLK